MQGKSHTVFLPLGLQMSNKKMTDFTAASRKSAVNDLQGPAPLARFVTYGIDVSSSSHSYQRSPKTASFLLLGPFWGVLSKEGYSKQLAGS